MFAKITLGSSGSILVKIIIIISNLGICCAYLKIFGETMQTTFQAFVSSDSYWVTNWHNYIYILFISVIMIFFVFAKSMDKFKQISFIGVISISIFLIFLSVMFFSKLYLNILPEINKDFLFPQCTAVQALQSLPTVFLAFSFQFNVFPIFYSLQNKTMNEMLKASIIGVIFCFVLFLLTGIFGFLMFGTRMNDTILKELFLDMVIYKENHSFIKYIIIIINFSFVMSTLMGFPIMFYSLKVNFLNSILFCRKRCFKVKELVVKGKVEQKVEISNENAENNKEDSPMNKKDSNFSSLTEKIVIVSLYFSIVLITILIPNLMMVSYNSFIK